MDVTQIHKDMTVVGADGVHVGIVSEVEHGRIKIIIDDSQAPNGHAHSYWSTGLIADIEGSVIRLSATADVAFALFAESQ
jgi:hypothetical protein